MMPSALVFNQFAVARLARQNELLRELRQLGCRALRAQLDTDLTVEVTPEAGSILRRHARAGILMEMIDGQQRVSTSFRNCRVLWMEAA